MIGRGGEGGGSERRLQEECERERNLNFHGGSLGASIGGGKEDGNSRSKDYWWPYLRQVAVLYCAGGTGVCKRRRIWPFLFMIASCHVGDFSEIFTSRLPSSVQSQKTLRKPGVIISGR